MTLRRWIVHNWHLKIASVLLSLMLWSAIANERRVEVPFQASVQFRNMPRSLELGNEVPTSVQVWVRGPVSTVRQLTSADTAVELNLAGFNAPGERTYTLKSSDVHVPFGVHVTQIYPTQLRLGFEARLQREVPIIPRFVGNLAPGYVMAPYQVIPPSIRVVGPESHVRVLEAASTDPVDITGVIARSQFWSNPSVSDPLVRVESNQPVRVTVLTKKQP